VAYAKRIQAPESREELLSEIDAAASEGMNELDVVSMARCVSAVIRLTRGCEYDRVIRDLEELSGQLRFGDHNELYGLVRRYIGSAKLTVGEHSEARVAYEDALSVFRRYEMRLSYAATLNDYAVLRSRMGHYLDAREMLLEAVDQFQRLGVNRNRVLALTNLGIVHERLGSWSSAERYYRNAVQVFDDDGANGGSFTPLRGVCMTNIECLQIMRRQFGPAEAALRDLLNVVDPAFPDRLLAIRSAETWRVHPHTCHSQRTSRVDRCGEAT
jgi:tetratricopeptide (TPR) repeat protein